MQGHPFVFDQKYECEIVEISENVFKHNYNVVASSNPSEAG